MAKLTADVVASFKNPEETVPAIASLPPGYISGFAPSINDESQAELGPGIASVEGQRVDIGATRINDDHWISPRVGSFTYHVYLQRSGGYIVDSVAPKYDTRYLYYSHPFRSGRFICSLVLNADKTVSYINVMLTETLSALNFALGIPDDQITTDMIGDDQITSALIVDGAVIAGKIAANAVTTTEIAANTIQAGDIATTALQALIGNIADLSMAHYSSGSGTYDSPEEGDWQLFADDGRIYVRQYLNGGWSDVNKTSLGILVGTTLLSLIGCRGIWHPEAGDPPTEVIPTGNFHLLTFESDYADQNGVAPDSTSGVARSSTWSKFGTYSLAATSGAFGYLQYDDVLDFDQPIGASGWLNFPTAEDATNPAVLLGARMEIDASNYVHVQLEWDNSPTVLKVYLAEVVSGSPVQTVTASITVSAAAIASGDHHVGFVLDIGALTLSVVYDSTVSTESLSALTISGAIATNYIRVYANDITAADVTAYLDDVLFAYDDKCDPDLFVKHYLAGTAWDTSHYYNDIAIAPGPNGEIVPYGLTSQADDTKVVTSEFLFTDDNYLDYSASFTDGMSAATVTFTELPATTKAILVELHLADTATVCAFNYKRASGSTHTYEITGAFGDRGTNYYRGIFWLPTDDNSIYVTLVTADSESDFFIHGYKVGR